MLRRARSDLPLLVAAAMAATLVQGALLLGALSRIVAIGSDRSGEAPIVLAADPSAWRIDPKRFLLSTDVTRSVSWKRRFRIGITPRIPVPAAPAQPAPPPAASEGPGTSFRSRPAPVVAPLPAATSSARERQPAALSSFARGLIPLAAMGLVGFVGWRLLFGRRGGATHYPQAGFAPPPAGAQSPQPAPMPSPVARAGQPPVFGRRGAG